MNWCLLLDISANHLNKIAGNDYEVERQKLIETTIGLSLTAIVMSVPAYLLIRYTYFKIKKEFRFKTKFNQYNHVDALVLLSMNILRTNPDYFKEKCAYLKEYIIYLYPENDSFHESLKMAYEDVYRSESIVYWLNRFHHTDERKDVVRFLIHMAAKDGVVAPREQAELMRIVDAFALARQEWIELMADINRAFAEKQDRWRKRHASQSESTHIDLVNAALDYFGMDRGALDEDKLRVKYRSLVKKYHPDRHPDMTPEQLRELEVKFQELQLYYEELIKLL